MYKFQLPLQGCKVLPVEQMSDPFPLRLEKFWKGDKPEFCRNRGKKEYQYSTFLSEMLNEF
jgi:hypothetical protein